MQLDGHVSVCVVCDVFDEIRTFFVQYELGHTAARRIQLKHPSSVWTRHSECIRMRFSETDNVVSILYRNAGKSSSRAKLMHEVLTPQEIHEVALIHRVDVE